MRDVKPNMKEFAIQGPGVSEKHLRGPDVAIRSGGEDFINEGHRP